MHYVVSTSFLIIRNFKTSLICFDSVFIMFSINNVKKVVLKVYKCIPLFLFRYGEHAIQLSLP